MLATNIVVASYDKKVKTLLSMGITGIRVSECFNIVEAEKYFNLRDFNVLIVDIDIGLGTSTILKNVQNKYKLLVIMVGSDMGKAMKFVREGFSDFIVKPDDYGDRAYTREFTDSIVQHIKNTAKRRAEASAGSMITPLKWNEGGRATHIRRQWGSFSAAAIGSAEKTGNKVIGIASSTGGTEALIKLLQKLPKDMPPIVVVQHFPPNFCRSYARRLDLACQLNVKVAESPEELVGGTVYLGDAGEHIYVEKYGNEIILSSRVGKRINGVMPAADVLFDSLAEVVRENSMGVILTGMGNDGAKGLLAMKNAGARTIGQNEESCLVYGMPLAAKNIGAVDKELPLEEIHHEIINFANRNTAL